MGLGWHPPVPRCAPEVVPNRKRVVLPRVSNDFAIRNKREFVPGMICEAMGTLESPKGVMSIMVLAKEVSLGWHPPVPRRAPGAGPNRKRGTFPMGFQ